MTVRATSDIAAEVAAFRKNIEHCYDTMADRLTEIGTYLHCSGCGYSQTLTKEKALRYLAIGWPVHCGATMELRR